jgi:hypothetical protein
VVLSPPLAFFVREIAGLCRRGNSTMGRLNRKGTEAS